MIKPLKRNQNLVPLSKEHHLGLLCCWKIRKGISLDIELNRIVNYIRHFWNDFLDQHFKEEERELFIEIKDPLVHRAITEHAEIKSIVSSILEKGSNTHAEHLHIFTNKLDNHIRFEERILFPHLESVLSKEQLDAICIHTNVGANGKLIDSFEDEFWIEKQ